MPVTRKDSPLWKKLTRGSGLGDGNVVIGIHDSKREPNGASLADVARWNHWGTSTIPSRPFLLMALSGDRPDVQRAVKAVAKGVMQGRLTTDQALNLLGIWGVKEVQRVIQLGVEPPNAPSTVQRKGSSTPLIDKGQLRQAISYLIEHGTAMKQAAE